MNLHQRVKTYTDQIIHFANTSPYASYCKGLGQKKEKNGK